jgi:uncharacterized membrane protein
VRFLPLVLLFLLAKLTLCVLHVSYMFWIYDRVGNELEQLVFNGVLFLGHIEFRANMLHV